MQQSDAFGLIHSDFLTSQIEEKSPLYYKKYK